jgi:hypothetical protein
MQTSRGARTIRSMKRRCARLAPNHRPRTSPLRKTRVKCAWNRPRPRAASRRSGRRSRLREDATAGRGAALQIRSMEILEDGAGGRRSVGAVQETLEASFVPDGLFLADDLGSPTIPSETRSAAPVRGPPRTRGGSRPSTRIRNRDGSATGSPVVQPLEAPAPRSSEPWNLRTAEPRRATARG